MVILRNTCGRVGESTCKKGSDAILVRLWVIRRRSVCPEALVCATCGLPLPYEDGQFASAISSEVLEHIEGVEGYATELAPVTRHSIFVTVPDMSSIPFSFQTGTVSWRLRKDIHVNFFTSRSVVALLKDWFLPVKFYRLNNNAFHCKFIPGSAGAMFERINHADVQ